MKNNYSKAFQSMGIGCRVSDGVKVYRITHVITASDVIAVDLATEQSVRLAIEKLRLVIEEEGGSITSAGQSDKDLLGYSDKEWEVAEKRFKIIKPLLENKSRSRVDVRSVAEQAGVHLATVYRWINSYNKSENMSILVPEKRGRREGASLLEPSLEVIVKSAIEDAYLKKQRLTPQAVIDEVKNRCAAAKILPPHPNTVRNRINRIPMPEQLRRRGKKEEAKNKHTPIRGSFPGADYPFSYVQIDHTPADIICVDEVHRKAIGRPYLTLAIDVFSRMVAGFYLSYDPPSAASVAMCLAQAMCPKKDYLNKLGVQGDWPVWGVIGVVHCDNAREFRGKALERGVQEYGINLEFRRLKQPQYGGHIERLMRTVTAEMHKLPGTTFSNTKQRKEYDSEKEATITIKELERYLADFIVNSYHQRSHSGLDVSPLHKWNIGVVGDGVTPGRGLIPVPQHPDRILLDFLPFEERTIQRYGLVIDNINYYDPVLDKYINEFDSEDTRRKRKFIVRWHPSDISRVYFYDPEDAQYHAIPYRDISRPPVSMFELKMVKAKLREEGRQNINEHLIFSTFERLKKQIDEAQDKKKSARRASARSASAPDETRTVRLPNKKSKNLAEPYTAHHLPVGKRDDVEDDIFSQPVDLFDTSLNR